MSQIFDKVVVCVTLLWRKAVAAKIIIIRTGMVLFKFGKLTKILKLKPLHMA